MKLINNSSSNSSSKEDICLNFQLQLVVMVDKEQECSPVWVKIKSKIWSTIIAPIIKLDNNSSCSSNNNNYL